MRIAKKILAGAAILAVALPGSALGTAAANASTVPVVYSAQADGWHGYVKPSAIDFGQGGAPLSVKLV
jgi:hypothetical protein